jgi:hypothetical protein
MSAFSVSNTHINTILSWARHHVKEIRIYSNNPTSSNRFDLTISEQFTRCGQLLRDANNDSLECLYGHGERDDYFPQHIREAAFVSPVVILKALDCFNYQSCEPKDYEDSLCCKVINLIRSYAISALTGYNDAPWAINDSYFDRKEQHETRKTALLA